MARGKGEIKGWITRNGVHIPIYGHYSVRGGEEPQSRGAKWKRKKELSPRQVRQATTYLSTSNKESIKAVKAELNKMDDSKEVFSGVTVKDLKEHFAGVDENTTLGEYRKQLFDKDDQDNPIKEGKKEVFKEATKKVESTPEGQKRKETVDAIHKKDEQLAKGMKEVDKDDKYANRDWNKDVDDAKRYGYSAQTEEGKKPITKAEEERQAKQSFRDKKAQEQGFADDASMRSYNEETGVNKETWKEKGKTIEVNGKKINVKPGENNAQAIYRTAMEEQGKPVDREFYDSQRVDYNGKAEGKMPGQASSTKELNSKQQGYIDHLHKEGRMDDASYEAYKEVDDKAGYVNYLHKHGRLSDSDIAGIKEFGGQESSKVASNGAPRFSDDDARSNREVEWNGQKYQLQPTIDWDRAKNKEYVAGHTYVPIDAKEGKSQFFVAQDGSVYNSGSEYLRQKNSKQQASLTPDFSKMKYSEAGAYVAAHKKDFGLSEGADAYQAAYEIKKGTWKGTMPGQESTTPKVNKADAYNDKVFAKFKASGKTNQTITSDGYAGTMDDFRAAAKRAGVEIEYDKGYDEFYLKQPKQESTRASYKDANSRIANGEHTVDVKTDGSKRQINNAKKAIRKASNKAGENYGISEHKGTVTGSRLLEGGATFDTAVRNMSVSGLKQAYNTATGTERAQIRARLQALGYQFRGGKWTKK